MASQQYPVLDTNHPLPAVPAMRRSTRRREKPILRACPRVWHEAELRASAQSLAGNCGSPVEPIGVSAFELRWRKTRESVQAVQHNSETGRDVSSRFAGIARKLDLLKAALDEGKQAAVEVREFPWISLANYCAVPRSFAVAESYLNTVQWEFEETTLEIFLETFQRTVPVAIGELWRVKSYIGLALTERIVRVADTSSSDAEAANDPRNPATPDSYGKQQENLLASLTRFADTDWQIFFERVNEVERILRKDPADAYARMDFESRAAYRQAVTALAKRCPLNEHEVARKAMELAERNKNAPDALAGGRRRHVGYYLVDEGREELEKQTGYRPSVGQLLQRWIKHWPDFSYILAIEFLMLAIITAIVMEANAKVSGFIFLLLFLLPAAECAVALVNQMVTHLFPPKLLPKLDFSKGIPAECATIVAVPTLLSSEEQMQRVLRDLEVRYLANRDTHLHFALLTDPPDAGQQFDEKDALAAKCVELIGQLNAKYADEGRGSFFLFHRHRSYNPSEGIWMGYERKRGKLLDFNKLLLGTADNFPVKAGNLSLLHEIKYVITLDADTQLPRDNAARLIGAIAHPLNKAVIHPDSNTVVEGYGILQPRVDISIHSAGRSRLAAIFSADAGFDIYTRAVSDVYQDLFGEGSFTGKGIYEVETFQRVLEHRFPVNTILSHDMIEGGYTRAGLVSDIEVVDDYPSRMSALNRRQHRWVRGDWQIVFWLFPKVPDFCGKLTRNPLTIIARWKILDNLRRSLTEIATFALLVSGWIILPGKALYWTLATLCLMATPVYFQHVLAIFRGGRALFRKSFWKIWWQDFVSSQANLLLRLVFLFHQSMVTMDAVIRTMIRLTVTHERLLEWETMAESEESHEKRSPVDFYLKATPWLSFAGMILLTLYRPEALLPALPLLLLWVMSESLGEWLDQSPARATAPLRTKDAILLRTAALRTWRFFREHSNAQENWLIPDTVQKPDSLIVHRVSTTNLGLLLNARISAVDLGFFTWPEFISDTNKTLNSVDRMPKFNGQLYNWYDNRTLEPVKPRFISTVDNGNLVCCLWTVKQGCLAARKKNIFGPHLWQGVQDHLRVILESLSAKDQKDTFAPAIQRLIKRVGVQMKAGTIWEGTTFELKEDIEILGKELSHSTDRDISWWGAELMARLEQLETMVTDFAPWLLPQFQKCHQDAGVQTVLSTVNGSLQSLSPLCSALEERLLLLTNDANAGTEMKCQAELLRIALARTTAMASAMLKELERLAERADRLAQSVDFSVLFNPQKKLLATGYDVEANRLTASHYDLLASEARAATFVAIAKGEIPQKSWMQLKRPFRKRGKKTVLLSWTGTMFEYLMPLVWMKTWPNTILDQAARSAVQWQRRYAEKKSIPWGISESSCAKLSVDGHFHYEAFGVPALAANPTPSEDLVVAPYATFLALAVNPHQSIKNIRRMAKLGWVGTYGYYEAIDFSSGRSQAEIVPCWLAHHQAMNLISTANLLCNASTQERFHAEARVAATERLLHEKAPDDAAIQAYVAVEEDGGELETAATEAVAEAGAATPSTVPKLHKTAGIS